MIGPKVLSTGPEAGRALTGEIGKDTTELWNIPLLDASFGDIQVDQFILCTRLESNQRPSG